MGYCVLLLSEGDGVTATVPDLPGVIAGAETREQVLAGVREAIDLYLEYLREHDEPIPEPKDYEIVAVGPGTVGSG